MNRLAVDCLDNDFEWNAEEMTEWEQKINISLHKLRHRIPIQNLISQELFSVDGCRYTIKAGMYGIFEIFPWFAPPREKNRYRESLIVKKGEKIEAVIIALEFFQNVDLDEADYLNLREYFLRTGRPERLLWSIVDLKIHFEDQRFLRYNTGLQVQ
jgi:hypothetical protein